MVENEDGTQQLAGEEDQPLKKKAHDHKNCHGHGGNSGHSRRKHGDGSEDEEEEDADDGGVEEEGHDENMYGVFLHVLADTLGSVGVIISCFLIKYYGLLISDPICSGIISILILLSLLPLLKSTSNVLLMRVPSDFQHHLKIILKKVNSPH